MRGFQKLMDFFRSDPTPDIPTQPKLVVTEGIAGYWHYHISLDSRYVRGLCGAQTMYTAIPIDKWGVPFGEHFPKRPTWCKQCEQHAGVSKC